MQALWCKDVVNAHTCAPPAQATRARKSRRSLRKSCSASASLPLLVPMATHKGWQPRPHPHPHPQLLPLLRNHHHHRPLTQARRHRPLSQPRRHRPQVCFLLASMVCGPEVWDFLAGVASPYTTSTRILVYGLGPWSIRDVAIDFCFASLPTLYLGSVKCRRSWSPFDAYSSVDDQLSLHSFCDITKRAAADD